MGQTRVISGPHIRTDRTTRSVMMNVSISLIPALLGAIYFFGIRALYIAGLSVTVCVLTEYLWQKLTRKQVTAGDFSAVVTGLLITFNMPVTVPVWVVIAADVFAILFVKQMFGGLGNNFVNPALMGRLLIMLVWPSTVMQYVAPRTITADAVSSATVLGAVKNGGEAAYSYFQMFIGEMPGAMGETSALLLLIGFGYMCYMEIVNAEAAFTYIGTVVALTFVFGPSGLFTGDILLNLFGGGLILGGCYMMTDYAFASRRGRLLYAVTAGVITAGIRVYGNYPEGVCFGILAANCLTGALSMVYRQHVYGTKKRSIKNGYRRWTDIKKNNIKEKQIYMEVMNMQNKNVKGIMALVLVTVLSFGVILGSRQLAKNNGGNADTAGAEEAKVVAELDVNGTENIEKAVQTENGYMVTVKTKGYVGDIMMNVSFEQDAKTITSVEVLEQSETENFGALIAEDEFLSQFIGAATPVYLPGMTLGTDNTKAENTADNAETEEAALNDGTYTAEAAEEYNGYRDMMTMTVEGGKITSVIWDSVDADGNLKSVQSENGEYVMTEDGPIWKEQAEALAAALVEEQNLSFLTVNEEGKTDAVSGVSISIYGFISMAEKCLKQAAGEEVPVEEAATEEAPAEAAPQNGTQVDAVSGATVSSTAAVKGINAAYNFLQSVK